MVLGLKPVSRETSATPKRGSSGSDMGVCACRVSAYLATQRFPASTVISPTRDTNSMKRRMKVAVPRPLVTIRPKGGVFKTGVPENPKVLPLSLKKNTPGREAPPARGCYTNCYVGG